MVVLGRMSAGTVLRSRLDRVGFLKPGTTYQECMMDRVRCEQAMYPLAIGGTSEAVVYGPS
jgi:hypothetical protein